MDEETIYRGICDKNEDVLEATMLQYKALFYYIGVKLLFPYGTYEDISDCIMETWFYVWNNIEDFLPETYTFKSWCLLIFKSRVLNQRAHNIKHYIKTGRYIPEEKTDAESLVIDKENCKDIIKAIETLPPPKKDIYYLRYVKQMTIEEIARQLQLSVENIYYHIRTGKKMLRGRLDDEQRHS